MIKPLTEEELDAFTDRGADYFGSVEQYYIHLLAQSAKYEQLKQYIEKQHPWVKESTK